MDCIRSGFPSHPIPSFHNKLRNILKEMGVPDQLKCNLRKLYAGQEVTELNMEQRTGKGMHQGYILSPAYLTYTQSTSCKMPGWMKHKLGSRLPEKMAITSDMQMTPVLWRRGTKEHLDEGESEE